MRSALRFMSAYSASSIGLLAALGGLTACAPLQTTPMPLTVGRAQLVLPPPSIHALSTPAQVLEQEQRLAQAMSYVTAVAESRPAIKADKTYQRCIEAANCYNRMIYTSSLIYNDSVTRFNNTLKQKHFAPLAGLLGFAPREYLQFAPDAPVVCSAQPTPPTQKAPA